MRGKKQEGSIGKEIAERLIEWASGGSRSIIIHEYPELKKIDKAEIGRVLYQIGLKRTNLENGKLLLTKIEEE